MQQPEYRALVSLEKTIEDLSIYMQAAHAPVARARAASVMSEPEPEVLDVNAMDADRMMRQGMDHVADAMTDALRAPKLPSAARTMDHLPSHRVA